MPRAVDWEQWEGSSDEPFVDVDGIEAQACKLHRVFCCHRCEDLESALRHGVSTLITGPTVEQLEALVSLNLETLHQISTLGPNDASNERLEALVVDIETILAVLRNKRIKWVDVVDLTRDEIME